MQRAYFDSNVLFDVLGRRLGMFDQVRSAVQAGHVEIVISDTNLVEFFAGADRAEFRSEVENLLTLQPRWIFVATLSQRELMYEYGRVLGRTLDPPFRLLEDWREFFHLFTTEAERQDVPPEVFVPTVDGLCILYSAEGIRDRLRYWKAELKAYQGRVREEMVYVRTRRNFVWKTIAHSLGVNFRRSADVVDRLWTGPDVAPAFRVDVELTLEELDRDDAKWTTNNFLDHVHARVLPYVDLFLTRDGRCWRNWRGSIQMFEYPMAPLRMHRRSVKIGAPPKRGCE